MTLAMLATANSVSGVATPATCIAARTASDVPGNKVADVKAEIANLKAGRSTNFAVLQRQDELVDAELRKARSIADHHIAVARLEFLTGTLLTRYGVAVRAPRR